MISNFDHVTVVVVDVDEAVNFFGLLGFELDRSVVISGPVMDAYMGVPGIVADHITLVIPGSEPRQEVQLLHYRSPRSRSTVAPASSPAPASTTCASASTTSTRPWPS